MLQYLELWLLLLPLIASAGNSGLVCLQTATIFQFFITLAEVSTSAFFVHIWFLKKILVLKT